MFLENNLGSGDHQSQQPALDPWGSSLVDKGLPVDQAVRDRLLVDQAVQNAARDGVRGDSLSLVPEITASDADLARALPGQRQKNKSLMQQFPMLWVFPILAVGCLGGYILLLVFGMLN